ncbi:hypothetical protein D1BOALGB6SA_1423 [Olavius sp. associated proteobacterium Delta 1]|nr:hypothetical protein D1BOALGB6SA_1423 [Olavius sp. associated proteobacterium Delta 1]
MRAILGIPITLGILSDFCFSLFYHLVFFSKIDLIKTDT